MSGEQNEDQGQQQQVEAEQRPHEAWGEAKGFLPRLGKPGPTGGPRQNPNYGKYAMAVAHRKWPAGQLVTEADFDAAVDEAGNQISR